MAAKETGRWLSRRRSASAQQAARPSRSPAPRARRATPHTRGARPTPPAPQLAEARASEVQSLLRRLGDLNDEMGGLAAGGSDARAHTIARHRDVLTEYMQVGGGRNAGIQAGSGGGATFWGRRRGRGLGEGAASACACG